MDQVDADHIAANSRRSARHPGADRLHRLESGAARPVGHHWRNHRGARPSWAGLPPPCASVGTWSYVAFLVSAVLGGLVVGALARLAIPGRDPMPIWTTILLGIAGSILGGLVAGLFLGQDDYAWAFVFAVGGASLLLGLHRTFVQHRPLFGAAARRRPR